MTERTRSPPPAFPPHLSHLHEIWHLGRGKAGRAARPLPARSGSRWAAGERPRVPPELLRPGLQHRPRSSQRPWGQEMGGRGSLCSSVGPFLGPFEQRGRSGAAYVPQSEAPRSSHAAGPCSVPGSVRETHACSACPGGRSPEASPSAEGKQSIKRKIVCVRVSATS